MMLTVLMEILQRKQLSECRGGTKKGASFPSWSFAHSSKYITTTVTRDTDRCAAPWTNSWHFPFPPPILRTALGKGWGCFIPALLPACTNGREWRCSTVEHLHRSPHVMRVHLSHYQALFKVLCSCELMTVEHFLWLIVQQNNTSIIAQKGSREWFEVGSCIRGRKCSHSVSEGWTYNYKLSVCLP